VKEYQSVEKSGAGAGAVLPGGAAVAGSEAHPTGELQFGQDCAIFFWGRGMIGLKSPHNGKNPEISHLPAASLGPNSLSHVINQTFNPLIFIFILTEN
jgi:hypothetical protein